MKQIYMPFIVAVLWGHTRYETLTGDVKIYIFCFPEVLMYSRENKTNWFPEGPVIKCFVIFLDFLQQQQKNKSNNGSEPKQSTQYL